MTSFIKGLKNRLSKSLQGIRALFQKAPVKPSPDTKAVTRSPIPIRSVAQGAIPTIRVASRGSRALLPSNMAISTLCVLAADNRIDELANQICCVAVGTTGAAIGGAIGRLGGPIGMTVGAALGGMVGGMLGDLGYASFKEWLFTEGEDGVRPIDRIAGKLRTATDTLRAATEVSAVIASGRAEVFNAPLGNGRGMVGFGSGSG